MSEQAKPFNVEPAGLNLLPPTGVDTNASLVLANWRTDSAGGLFVRTGHSSPGVTVPAAAHSLFLSRAPSKRYVGHGTTLTRLPSDDIVTGMDGEPVFLVEQDAYVWIMNRNAQKKDDGTTVSPWVLSTPIAPVATDFAAGDLAGVYKYYLTFANAREHESAPSPFAEISVTDRTVRITAPAFPTGVTKAYVYREGGDANNPEGILDFPLRVGTINLSGGTFDDNVLNTTARNINTRIDFNLMAAPACRSAFFHQGRIFGLSTVEDPNGIYWTLVNKFHAWQAQNFLPIGSYGDELLRGTSKGPFANLYKNASIWRLVGDPGQLFGSSIEIVSADLGLVGPKALVESGPSDYFLSRKGVYRLGSGRPELVSAELNPIFDGRSVEIGSGDVLPGINLAAIASTCMATDGENVYVSYPAGVATQPSVTAVLHVPSGRWFQDTRAFGVMNWEGVDREFVAVLSGASTLVSLDSGNTDDGAPIDAAYLSQYVSPAGVEREARVAEIIVECDTKGQNWQANALLNDGDDTVALGTLNTSNLNPVRFAVDPPNGQVIRNLALEIQAP